MTTVSQTYPIQGMHCASCANIIERKLQKTEGVKSVSVNYGNESMRIELDPDQLTPAELPAILEPLGYSIVLPVASGTSPTANTPEDTVHAQKLQELESMRKSLFSVLPIAAFAWFVMGWEILASFDVVPDMPRVWYVFFHHLLPLFATYVLFIVGKPYLI